MSPRIAACTSQSRRREWGTQRSAAPELVVDWTVGRWVEKGLVVCAYWLSPLRVGAGCFEETVGLRMTDLDVGM
jgi:hypothetical protein